MEFINKGLDESTLCSIPADCASDELIKAMGRQGLVQKEVQVKGKNGQTFTRKQWVKAGEDQTAQKQPKAKEDTKEKKTSDSSDSSWKKPTSKKELAEMLASGMSRDDIMSKAKESGVTWKEHDHAGINWMRCSMALTGATTKGTKADTNTTNTEKTEQKSTNDSDSKNSKSDDTVEETYENGKIDKNGDLVANDKEDLGELVSEVTGTDMFDQRDIVSNQLEGKYNNPTIEQIGVDKASVNKDGSVDVTFYVEGYDEDDDNFDTYVTVTIPKAGSKTKSVIGSDYTQLTTEDEAGTIEGEVHNM